MNIIMKIPYFFDVIISPSRINKNKIYKEHHELIRVIKYFIINKLKESNKAIINNIR